MRSSIRCFGRHRDGASGSGRKAIVTTINSESGISRRDARADSLRRRGELSESWNLKFTPSLSLRLQPGWHCDRRAVPTFKLNLKASLTSSEQARLREHICIGAAVSSSDPGSKLFQAARAANTVTVLDGCRRRWEKILRFSWQTMATEFNYTARFRILLFFTLHLNIEIQSSNDSDSLEILGRSGRQCVLHYRPWQEDNLQNSGNGTEVLTTSQKHALRLIVITYRRAESFLRLLKSLLKASYNNESVALDILIDR